MQIAAMAERFAPNYPTADFCLFSNLKKPKEIPKKIYCVLLLCFFKPMNGSHLVDFYQGWLIEVVQIEGRFSSTCYSPCREKLSSHTTHPSDFGAFNAAKRVIDHYGACYSLTLALRDLYETERIGFEEWRSLQQSLTNAMKAI